MTTEKLLQTFQWLASRCKESHSNSVRNVKRQSDSFEEPHDCNHYPRQCEQHSVPAAHALPTTHVFPSTAKQQLPTRRTKPRLCSHPLLLHLRKIAYCVSASGGDQKSSSESGTVGLSRPAQNASASCCPASHAPTKPSISK